MKKLLIIIFILLVLSSAGLHLSGYSVVGGPLCGPICPPQGASHWQRACLGFTWRRNTIDGYYDYCIGLPAETRHCFAHYLQENGERGYCEMPCEELTQEYMEIIPCRKPVNQREPM